MNVRLIVIGLSMGLALSARPAVCQEPVAISRSKDVLYRNSPGVASSQRRIEVLHEASLGVSKSILELVPGPIVEEAARRVFGAKESKIVIAPVRFRHRPGDTDKPVSLTSGAVVVGAVISDWQETSSGPSTRGSDQRSRDGKSTNDKKTEWRKADGSLLVAVAGTEEATSRIEEFTAAVEAGLTQELIAKNRPAIEEMKSSIQKVEANVRAKESELRTLQEEVAQREFQQVIPKDAFAQRQASTEQLKQATELELVGLEARAAALREQMEVAQVTGAKQSVSDSSLQALEEIVAIREQKMQHVKALRATAAISATEELEARESLLSAKIDLARSKAGGQQSNMLAEKLNSSLVETTVDITSAKARLQYLQKALAESSERLQELARFESQTRELTSRAKELTTEFFNLRQRAQDEVSRLHQLEAQEAAWQKMVAERELE